LNKNKNHKKSGAARKKKEYEKSWATTARENMRSIDDSSIGLIGLRSATTGYLARLRVRLFVCVNFTVRDLDRDPSRLHVGGAHGFRRRTKKKEQRNRVSSRTRKPRACVRRVRGLSQLKNE
jgi:hypothetical protein